MKSPIGYVHQPQSVNPHCPPDPNRIARILDSTLDTLVALHAAGDVPATRLRLAGIPSRADLERELRRREHAHREVA
jgi:hypothetical protein